MREILFRGKGIDTGDWIYGSLVYSPKENRHYIVENIGDELSYLVDSETVCVMCGEKNIRNDKMYCEACQVQFRVECTYYSKYYGCELGKSCGIDCKDFKRKE